LQHPPVFYSLSFSLSLSLSLSLSILTRQMEFKNLDARSTDRTIKWKLFICLGLKCKRITYFIIKNSMNIK
jgi:hypothetical protein